MCVCVCVCVCMCVCVCVHAIIFILPCIRHISFIYSGASMYAVSTYLDDKCACFNFPLVDVTC